MNDTTIKYRVNLKVLSAISIGYGREYLKFEYIKDGNKITFIDEKKLFDKLCQYKLQDEYLDFIEKSSRQERNSDSSLYKFLKDRAYRRFDVDSLIEEVKLYSIQCNYDKLANVKCFIKDKVTNKCYIPGSTIKGMLRTALDQSEKLQKYSNDIMREISVSDSSLISNDNLQILDTYYYNISKGIEKSKPLNQYNEFLKKDTECSFDITVDKKIIVFDNDENKKKSCSGDVIINNLFLLIRRYFEQYKNYYLQYYENEANGKLKVLNQKESAYICFIGQKCGFPNKTIYYQKYKLDAGEKISKKLKVNSRNGKTVADNYDKKFRLSPVCLKIVDQDNKWYPCGAVELTYKKVEDER